MTAVFDFHVRLGPQPEAPARLLAALDAGGITRAAVCAGGVIELDRLSSQLVEGGHVATAADNDAVLAACAGSGGRLVPFYFACATIGAAMTALARNPPVNSADTDLPLSLLGLALGITLAVVGYVTTAPARTPAPPDMRVGALE